MLKRYRAKFCVIKPNTPGEVQNALWYKQHRLDGDPLEPKPAPVADSFDAPRTHTSRIATQHPRVICRMRAVATMFGFDHAITGAIAKQLMKRACHVRACVDRPATHLAFSPPGVKSRDMARRRSLTIGKYLTRKCGPLLYHLASRQSLPVECLVAKAEVLYAPTTQLGCEIRLVAGKDAHAVYASGAIKSCMSGDFSDSYTADQRTLLTRHHFLANPDKLRLAVAYDENGRLVMRAKVYTNDDGTLFLDRVFTAGCLSVQFTIPAVEHAISLFLISVGYALSADYDITLRHDAGEYMPYLDKAGDFDRISDEEIRLHKDGQFAADRCNGLDPSVGEEMSTLDDDCETCDRCGCNLDDDESTSTDDGETLCLACYDRSYAWDYIGSEEIAREDAVDIDLGPSAGCTTHRDRCRCTVNGFVLRDACVQLHDGTHLWKDDPDLVMTVDSELAYAADCEYLYTEGYAIRADAVQLTDGRWAKADDPDLVATTELDGTRSYTLTTEQLTSV